MKPETCTGVPPACGCTRALLLSCQTRPAPAMHLSCNDARCVCHHACVHVIGSHTRCRPYISRVASQGRVAALSSTTQRWDLSHGRPSKHTTLQVCRTQQAHTRPARGVMHNHAPHPSSHPTRRTGAGGLPKPPAPPTWTKPGAAGGRCRGPERPA